MPRPDPPSLSEADWQALVMDTARLTGWRVAHFRPARTARGDWRTPMQGDPGFPDLVLVRAGTVLLAELKSDTGTVTHQQRAWLAALGEYGRLWRPRDWHDVHAELSRPPSAAFICPRCQRVSHHPTDAAEGYCGACRDWTRPKR